MSIFFGYIFKFNNLIFQWGYSEVWYPYQGHTQYIEITYPIVFTNIFSISNCISKYTRDQIGWVEVRDTMYRQELYSDYDGHSGKIWYIAIGI